MRKKTITTTRVLLLNEGRVFLMLRNGKGSSHGGHKRWIAPGGVTEKDESAMDCVIRETEEEIGLQLQPNQLTLLLEQYDPQFNANMVFYVCTEWKGQIKLQEKEKFDRVEWVKLSEVGKLDQQHDAHLGVFIEEAATILLNQKKKPVYSKW